MIISQLPFQAVLVTGQADLAYLTGVRLEGYWMVMSSAGATILAPALLADHLRSLLPGIKVISCANQIKGLAEFCRKSRIKELAADPQKLTHSLWTRISAVQRMKAADSFLSATRMIKEPVELEAIKQSCELTVSAMEYARDHLVTGITEIKIGYKIEEYFAKHNARIAFDPIVASGPNSANPHHINSARKIEKNDVVLIDIGCIFKGYCSDLTRTYFLGKMNNFQKRIFALVRDAHDHAIAGVRAGMKARAVDALARRFIAIAGYGKQFIHTTGHGVGIDIHEPPRLGPSDRTVLKPGMVVTVEPGVYLPGSFGVRIEDTILITEKGSEVLTQ